MSRSIYVIFASLLGVVLHFFIFRTDIGENYELRALDTWFSIRGHIAAPTDVVLISMDEMSYLNLEIPMNQPWPRALHAKLLQRLKEYGVKKVVFDVLFLGEGSDPQVDAQLAKAMSEVPTVIGANRSKESVESYGLSQPLLPLEQFRNVVKNVASVELPEEFGQVRKFLVPRKDSLLHLETLASAASDVSIDSPDYPKPRDLIQLYGPAGTIPSYHYYQVLEEEHKLPKQLLEGKTVFVGLMASSDIGFAQKDSFLTSYPENGRVFGVEIHATAAANLISKSWIHRFSTNSELIFTSCAVFLLSLLLLTLGPLSGVLVLAGSTLSWGAISYIAFLKGYFIPGAIFSTILSPLLYLGCTFYHYLITWVSREKIRKAFSLYLSPEMTKVIAKDPSSLRLGGETIVGTALFTDIADFTSISEHMGAENVTKMLNAYFSQVMEAIFASEGTLIKFIGDAAFAIWGAPVKVEDHTKRACQTALEIQSAVSKFNASKKYPALVTRIGVATGPMVCGNLGSEKRFDYTAIGDTINLAARLEGLNKYIGTDILLNEAAALQLDSSFHKLEIGIVKPKGKDQSTVIYGVFPTKLPEKAVREWASARELFAKRMWDQSREKFTQIMLDCAELKAAAQFYLEEIADKISTPPADGWAGEATFTSK